MKFTSFLNIFCSNFLVITEHTKSGFRSLESVFTGWLKRNVTEKYENLAFFKVFFPPSFLPSFLPSFEKEPVQEADGQKGRDREKQTPCLLNLKPCAEPHLVRSQEPEIMSHIKGQMLNLLSHLDTNQNLLLSYLNLQSFSEMLSYCMKIMKYRIERIFFLDCPIFLVVFFMMGIRFSLNINTIYSINKVINWISFIH